MLTITGDVLDVTDETVEGPRGSFISTEIHLMTGEGKDANVQHIRTGRDFAAQDRPKKGDKVTLNVVVSVWSGKNGAGYRLTALSRVHAAGARVSAVS